MKPGGLFGEDYKHKAKDILSSRFLVPPFSVLNTREGFWQDRKRQWINIGIKSELGRGYTEEGTAYGSSLGKSGELNGRYRDASPGGSPRPAMNQKGHVPGSPINRGDGRGRPLVKRPGLTFGINDIDEYRNKEAGAEADAPIGGTSIFDPVLCELIYRWFCPPGGRVIDPFAGGSVRGIVAAELGLHYCGIDLSERQVAANREQAAAIGSNPAPVWIHGDSLAICSELNPGGGEPVLHDLVMSCPPYGDLEVYSKDPRDLSSMSLDGFQETYRAIIAAVTSLAKPNAFACFVVGDYRDKDGYYCNLPGHTIACFEAAGWHLYNYAILLNAIGSLPLRINNQFNGSRKLGKTHQDVLVFVKGQPREFVKGWPALEI